MGEIGQSPTPIMHVIDIQYIALFQNESISKASAVENRGQISYLLTHPL